MQRGTTAGLRHAPQTRTVRTTTHRRRAPCAPRRHRDAQVRNGCGSAQEASGRRGSGAGGCSRRTAPGAMPCQQKCRGKVQGEPRRAPSRERRATPRERRAPSRKRRAPSRHRRHKDAHRRASPPQGRASAQRVRVRGSPPQTGGPCARPDWRRAASTDRIGKRRGRYPAASHLKARAAILRPGARKWGRYPAAPRSLKAAILRPEKFDSSTRKSAAGIVQSAAKKVQQWRTRRVRVEDAQGARGCAWRTRRVRVESHRRRAVGAEAARADARAEPRRARCREEENRRAALSRAALSTARGRLRPEREAGGAILRPPRSLRAALSCAARTTVQKCRGKWLIATENAAAEVPRSGVFDARRIRRRSAALRCSSRSIVELRKCRASVFFAVVRGIAKVPRFGVLRERFKAR